MNFGFLGENPLMRMLAPSVIGLLRFPSSVDHFEKSRL